MNYIFLKFLSFFFVVYVFGLVIGGLSFNIGVFIDMNDDWIIFLNFKFYLDSVFNVLVIFLKFVINFEDC